MPKIYTALEVAEYCRCSIQTIYSAIRNGELKAFRAGRLHRITQTQLDKYLHRTDTIT